jgi:glycosyltransferase involved in cell wall biosynthesis
LGRLAARLASVPVILFTAHGWSFTEGRTRWKQRLLALVERLTARLTDRIICVSEYDRQLAMKFKVGRPDQLVTIHNGLDPRSWTMVDRSTVRRALGLPGGDLLITMIARLAVQKDPLTLLEASRRLPGDHWRVLLVGEGPLASHVARFVTEHRLSDRVQLLGARMDAMQILAVSDIFVLSSHWEGLPLTIIEAMMAGLPVVATRVGGVDELIEDGVTGTLVPPRNAAALTAALDELLQNGSRRRQMGQAGRQRALGLFTLDLMIQQTRELYRECLTSHQYP